MADHYFTVEKAANRSSINAINAGLVKLTKRGKNEEKLKPDANQLWVNSPDFVIVSA